MSNARDELLLLRVAVARVAQIAGVDNHLGISDKSYQELVSIAKRNDSGWHNLAAEIADNIEALQAVARSD